MLTAPLSSSLAVHFGKLHFFFFFFSSELSKAAKRFVGLAMQSEPAVRQPFTIWQKPLHIGGDVWAIFQKGGNKTSNYVGGDTLCLDGLHGCPVVLRRNFLDLFDRWTGHYIH